MPKDKKGPLLPYFLLKPPIGGDKLYSMLGRVVADERRPDGPADFAPHRLVVPSKLVPDLYRSPVHGKDFESLKSAGTDLEAELHVSKLIKTHVKVENSTTDTRKATLYTRWDIDDPKGELTRLMKHSEYAKAVITFLECHDDQKAAFCTTVLALTDMEISIENKDSVDAGIEADVPADTLAPGLDTSLAVNASAHNNTKIGGTIVGESVFALGYVEIRLVKRTNHWYHHITDLFSKERVGNVEVSEEHLNPETGLHAGNTNILGDFPIVMGSRKDKTPEEADDSDDNEVEMPRIKLYL